MSRKRQVIWGLAAVYILGFVFFIAVWGLHGEKNETYKVIDSFKLETWFKIGPISFNKGVLYLLMATVLTLVTMLWVSRQMKRRPSRTQVAVEWMYDITRSMTRENMSEDLAQRWFPLIFTLFVFIGISNLIGYIPLPIDTSEPIHVLGISVPAFQIYAAVTNVAVPFVLALIVWISFNIEGVRHHGFRGYVKSLIPEGVKGPMLILMYPLEIVSNLLRLLSLTIRLWANLLAGHLLIDFMAGTLAVLLGLEVIGWLTLPIAVVIFLFEAVLIAGLQAFIFAILAAIYLGGATSQSH